MADRSGQFPESFGKARIVTIPDRTRACVGLIAVDEDDVVLGATHAARLLLNLTDSDLRKGILAMDLERAGADLDDTIVHAERGAIRRALVRTGGNVSASARALDISRATS